MGRFFDKHYKVIDSSADNRSRGKFRIFWSEVKNLQREVNVMAHPETNFCKQEEMCICTAGCQKQQTDCSYYEKSQHANRCMYFIFDEYCDSLKAQMDSAAVVTSSRY
jgi:hypothetical protein